MLYYDITVVSACIIYSYLERTYHKKKLIIAVFLVSFLALPLSEVNAQHYGTDDFVDIITDMMAVKKKISNEKNKPKDEDYEIIKYEDIMREREGMKDIRHTFYAEVQQYEEEKDFPFSFGLVKRNGKIDQAYYVVFMDLPDKRLMEGDNLDLYGTLHGIYTYETVIGGTKTVPVFFVEKVLIQGIDY